MRQIPASWYVQVSGQVYGPYNVATMHAFIQEGRIVGDSMISANPINGFSAAKNSAFFQSEPPAQATTAQPAPSQPVSLMPSSVVSYPGSRQPQPVQPYTTAAPVSQPLRDPSVFLIMAEINSENAMKFLHKMQKLGTAQRIGDTVWLLKTAMEVDDLRIQLSAPLTRQDRLFILDSFNNKPAWHNIGADMDQRIKELWDSK